MNNHLPVIEKTQAAVLGIGSRKQNSFSARQPLGVRNQFVLGRYQSFRFTAVRRNALDALARGKQYPTVTPTQPQRKPRDAGTKGHRHATGSHDPLQIPTCDIGQRLTVRREDGNYRWSPFVIGSDDGVPFQLRHRSPVELRVGCVNYLCTIRGNRQSRTWQIRQILRWAQREWKAHDRGSRRRLEVPSDDSGET